METKSLQTVLANCCTMTTKRFYTVYLLMHINSTPAIKSSGASSLKANKINITLILRRPSNL